MAQQDTPPTQGLDPTALRDLIADLDRQISVLHDRIDELELDNGKLQVENDAWRALCLKQKASVPTELPPHVRMAVNLIRRELHSYPDQASRWRIAAILDELDPPAPTDIPVVGTIGDVKQALHDLEPASNQRGFDPDDPDRPF